MRRRRSGTCASFCFLGSPHFLIGESSVLLADSFSDNRSFEISTPKNIIFEILSLVNCSSENFTSIVFSEPTLHYISSMNVTTIQTCSITNPLVCFVVQEPSDDYVANLPVPSFVIGGSADTDHDLSTTTDSTTSPRYRWSNHLDSPDLLMSEGSAAAALPGAILTSEVGGVLDAHHISSEDGDDTTEDEEGSKRFGYFKTTLKT